MRDVLKRWFPLLAGACDAVTGLMLVAAPRATLRLMGVGDALTEDVWMRWIGTFVLAMGLLYLVALVPSPRRAARLRHAMELTAVVRTAIALFVGACLLAGSLSLAWISVFATDAGLAVAQALMLRAGVFDGD